MSVGVPDDVATVERRSGSAAARASAGRTRLHASCVELQGRGVLLLGASGSGKSDLALRLIDGGAVLVADDQVSIERRGETLLAGPPEALAGRLEVRGLGILSLPFRAAVRLRLAVELDRAGELPRLPEPARYAVLGLDLPCIRLDPNKPSAAAIVRLALRAERFA